MLLLGWYNFEYVHVLMVHTMHLTVCLAASAALLQWQWTYQLLSVEVPVVVLPLFAV